MTLYILATIGFVLFMLGLTYAIIRALHKNQQLPIDDTLSQQNLELVSQLATATAKQEASEQRLQETSAQLLALQQEHQSQSDSYTTLRSDLAVLQNKNDSQAQLLQEKNTEIAELKASLTQAKTSYDELIEKNISLQKEVTEVKSQNESLKHLQETENKRNLEANAALEKQLKSLSENIVSSSSTSFQEQNAQHMTTIVSPLQKELATFRTMLTESQKIQSEQAGQLRSELTNLQKSQQILSLQANELALALKQGAKSQGMWGEHQLELVLESSGLVLGREYLREVCAKDDDDNMLRVDAVIRLPQDHNILIDSKCSLTAYVEYIHCQEELSKITDLSPVQEQVRHQELENAAADALKRHLQSIDKHIKELSEKNYPALKSLNSPSFIFMFVPIDHALGLASQHDPKLFTTAQQQNIYLVSPSSLLPALRVVSNLWILSHQQAQISTLIDAADKIYKKSQSVSKHFENVLSSQERLNKNMNLLSRSLYEGPGNLLKILDNFSTKNIFYKELLDKSLDEEPLQIVDENTPQEIDETADNITVIAK